MMIRKTAFNDVGGFDGNFHFYAEDADFCLRLQTAKWEVVSDPRIRVTHIRGGSSIRLEGYSDRYLRAQAEARLQFVTKHNPRWHVWLDCSLSRMHAKKTLLAYKVLRMATRPPYSSRASIMASVYERDARIQNELER